jgi:hypothetical protein
MFMQSRMLLLLLLLFSANSQAYEFPVEIIEFIDNAKIVASVSEGDIDEKLYWQPFEGPPPLSIAGALDAIQKHIASDPQAGTAELTGIELKRIPHHSRHWHYLVKMSSQVDGKPQPRYFIVLMTGKVIPGLREPETVK